MLTTLAALKAVLVIFAIQNGVITGSRAEPMPSTTTCEIEKKKGQMEPDIDHTHYVFRCYPAGDDVPT